MALRSAILEKEACVTVGCIRVPGVTSNLRYLRLTLRQWPHHHNARSIPSSSRRISDAFHFANSSSLEVNNESLFQVLRSILNLCLMAHCLSFIL